MRLYPSNGDYGYCRDKTFRKSLFVCRPISEDWSKIENWMIDGIISKKRITGLYAHTIMDKKFKISIKKIINNEKIVWYDSTINGNIDKSLYEASSFIEKIDSVHNIEHFDSVHNILLFIQR